MMSKLSLHFIFDLKKESNLLQTAANYMHSFKLTNQHIWMNYRNVRQLFQGKDIIDLAK